MNTTSHELQAASPKLQAVGRRPEPKLSSAHIFSDTVPKWVRWDLVVNALSNLRTGYAAAGRRRHQRTRERHRHPRTRILNCGRLKKLRHSTPDITMDNYVEGAKRKIKTLIFFVHGGNPKASHESCNMHGSLKCLGMLETFSCTGPAYTASRLRANSLS